MFRNGRFPQVMRRIALMGALLMVVAPLISRWIQSQGEMATPAIQAMCHGQAAPMSAMPGMGRHAHPMSMGTTMAVGMTLQMEPGDGMPMPPGHEDMVCDYCVLAAQLLPCILVLLLLPLLQVCVQRPAAEWGLPRRASAWAAHGARGPPVILIV